MTYPVSAKTIHTPIKSELVRYGDGKLGTTVGTLSEPDDNGKLAGYLVMSFDKKEKFALLATSVTIVPEDDRPKVVKEYKKLLQGQAPKKAPRQRKIELAVEETPVVDLAEVLANTDVGPHDTALSYATELVKYVRANFGIDFSIPDNAAMLWHQFVYWSKQNNKPAVGIDETNLMDRIEGELFYITQDKLLKHRPLSEPRDEAAAIEAGYKRQKKVMDPSAVKPQPLADEYFGKYAYHNTSFVNLYIIARTGLLRSAGGSPGGSCYLAEDIAQRDDSIQHSKKVIAAAFGRFALNTYVNQREDRADKVLADDATARNAKESELQSDLDEHAALLRFKITAEHLWVTDPQDSRALLLSSADVTPAELDCLTSEGWVSVTKLAELGPALQFDDGGGGSPEFQVFVRQSERVQWRLDHDPTDNDILEGRAFVERGAALLEKLDTDSTPHAQVAMVITMLTEKLATLRIPKTKD